MSDQLHNLSDEQNSTKPDTPYHYELSAMLQQIAQGASASQNSIKNCSKSIFLSRSISLFILVLAASLLVYVISVSSHSYNTTYIAFSDDAVNASTHTSSSSKKSVSSKSKSKSSSSKSGSSKSSKSSSKSHAAKSQAVSPSSAPEDLTPQNTAPDFSYYPFNEVGNSSSNVQNGSFLSMQGDWIYYINSQDENTVYKMRNSGEEDQKVCDIAATSVSLVGESAFIGCMEWSNTLQDIRWDGSGTRMFTVGCNSVTAYTDYMITSDSCGIYLTSYDSTLKEKLYSGSPSRCCCENGRVYFLEEDALYSISIDNPEDIRIEVPGAVQSYAVTDDDIYYCLQNQLYSVNRPNTPLFGLQTSCINITDGILYYANQLDNESLYSIRLDGSGHIKLSTQPTQAICVAGDWIAIQSDGEIILL